MRDEFGIDHVAIFKISREGGKSCFASMFTILRSSVGIFFFNSTSEKYVIQTVGRFLYPGLAIVQGRGRGQVNFKISTFENV